MKILRHDVLALPGGFEDFVKEVNAMHSLDHENLIRLFGVVLSSPLMMVSLVKPAINLMALLNITNLVKGKLKQ